MTTVEDERQRDSLLQQRAEESRQFLVPDVEYSSVGVRRHNRLVVPRRLGPAVDALGAVAGVVEDDDIPRLRIRNELLDRADDVLARGGGVLYQADVGRVEVEAVAEQVSHRLRVVDRPVQGLGDQVAPRRADPDLELHPWRRKSLVVVDADQQRPAGLGGHVARDRWSEENRGSEHDPNQPRWPSTVPADDRPNEPPARCRSRPASLHGQRRHV